MRLHFCKSGLKDLLPWQQLEISFKLPMKNRSIRTQTVDTLMHHGPWSTTVNRAAVQSSCSSAASYDSTQFSTLIFIQNIYWNSQPSNKFYKSINGSKTQNSVCTLVQLFLLGMMSCTWPSLCFDLCMNVISSDKYNPSSNAERCPLEITGDLPV